MPELSELLEEESKHFVATETFLRHYAHIRGLEPTPSEREIAFHLATCKEYYETYGTIDGKYTPWLSGRWSNGPQAAGS